MLASAFAACLCRPPPREQVGKPFLHSALRSFIERIKSLRLSLRAVIAHEDPKPLLHSALRSVIELIEPKPLLHSALRSVIELIEPKPLLHSALRSVIELMEPKPLLHSALRSVIELMEPKSLLHSELRSVIVLMEPKPLLHSALRAYTAASAAPHPTREGCGANGGKDIRMRLSYDACVCRMTYADACVFCEGGCGAHGAPRR